MISQILTHEEIVTGVIFPGSGLPGPVLKFFFGCFIPGLFFSGSQGVPCIFTAPEDLSPGQLCF